MSPPPVIKPPAVSRFSAFTGGLVFSAVFLTFSHGALADDSKSIKQLRDALVALAPDVNPAEAELVSGTAHNTARRLAREWHVVSPASFQNFLIHIGKRQWGYCFHWAYAIGGELKELRLKTLVLHWGASRPGSLSENNRIVVTARGQPFDEGYVIDAWRQSGRLFCGPVKHDGYPWKEDLQETAWLNDYKAPNKGYILRSDHSEHVGSGKTHAPTPRQSGSLE